MKPVNPRQFRISQINPYEWIVEEGVTTFGLFGRKVSWSRINSSGKRVTYDATCGSVDSAREAIKVRKECLRREDEFPRVISVEMWDGITATRVFRSA